MTTLCPKPLIPPNSPDSGELVDFLHSISGEAHYDSHMCAFARLKASTTSSLRDTLLEDIRELFALRHTR